MKHAITLLPALLLLSASLRAADVEIENEVLAVRYDDAAKTFSILHKPTQRTFVKGAAFTQPVQRAWVAVGGGAPHPVFGQGRGIEFDHADGSVSRVDLYPKLEFAVIKGLLRNHTKETLVVGCLGSA